MYSLFEDFWKLREYELAAAHDVCFRVMANRSVKRLCRKQGLKLEIAFDSGGSRDFTIHDHLARKQPFF